MAPRLTLRGEAELRVGLVFRVYEASFHLEERTDTPAWQNDVPKRLVLRYARDIPARRLIEAGNEALARQLAPGEQSALQSRLDSINALYRDVRAGDVYTLDYQPGRGSELALNGTPLGVIPGADFAAAYFGIWLDPRNPYESFRRALLGEG